MSAQRCHLDDRHPYGATCAPISHQETSSGPSAAFAPRAEGVSLAVRYEAPRSTFNAQIFSHTPCHSNRVSSFVCSHSFASGCCGNAFESTSSSPPSPSLPHPVPSPSPKHLNTSTIAAGNTLLCNVCKAKFTGLYRRGNLARHVKHQHANASKVPYMCRLAGCLKVFARSDARLKHERKQHPWLHPEPIERRFYNTVSHEEPAADTPTATMGPVPHAEGSTTPTSARYQPIYLRDSSSQHWPTLSPSVLYEPSRTSNTEYYTAPAMSAQSSSQGLNNHGSSQYYHSQQTGPTSVHDTIGTMGLSSPVLGRSFPHASRTSDGGCTTPQPIQPGPLDFPEAPAQPDDPRCTTSPVTGHRDSSVSPLQDDDIHLPAYYPEEYSHEEPGLMKDILQWYHDAQ
ncbi:hypothetical protein DDE82_008232 [Stemphylium lycopersici]|nr:hypothetical protein DDE82_008232 [Stemphylium lycopersici]